MRNADRKVVEDFGYEWQAFDQGTVPDEERARAFGEYFEKFPWQDLPRDAVGFDLGCGSGRWARFVAPRVERLHCIDASALALAAARRHLTGLSNCEFHCASVDEIPLAQATMDFGYSLGVLHHVPDTAAALRECVTRLKMGAPFLVYLYYALENRPPAYRALYHATDRARRVLSRLPRPAKRLLTEMIAAGVYYPLARGSLLMERMGLSPAGMPLAHYRRASFTTMRTDAFDRFATRLEKRFTRAQVHELMAGAGLTGITFREGTPYWCAVGRRCF
jgi:SAM-dependent methyltransferase